MSSFTETATGGNDLVEGFEYTEPLNDIIDENNAPTSGADNERSTSSTATPKRRRRTRRSSPRTGERRPISAESHPFFDGTIVRLVENLVEKADNEEDPPLILNVHPGLMKSKTRTVTPRRRKQGAICMSRAAQSA